MSISTISELPVRLPAILNIFLLIFFITGPEPIIIIIFIWEKNSEDQYSNVNDDNNDDDLTYQSYKVVRFSISIKKKKCTSTSVSIELRSILFRLIYP